MKRLPAVFGLGALMAALGVFVAVALATNPPEPPGNHVPVTICHATNSETNPYVIESPDNDSIIKAGHGDHTGLIFEIGMKADKVRWGDVIPAFTWWELEKVDGVKTWVEKSYPGMNGGDISKCITTVPGDTEVTATAPTFIDPTCDVGAGIVIPEVTGVQYKVKGTVAPGETVEVKAKALPGYELMGTEEWEHTYGRVPENCAPPTGVTPTAPTFQDPTCDVGAAVNLPTVKGVTYTVKGTVAPGETVNVKATADEGYVLVGTDKWEHTFGQVPSNCSTPPPPHKVTGDASVSCILPDGYYGVSGTVDGQAADKVDPATIPGNTKGSTKVTVTRGDTSVKTTVSTNGDCGNAPPPVVTPPAVVTPPPVVTPPVETTPTTKPTAPLTPPTTKKKTTKTAPAQTKPAPLTPPKKAVAGAYAQEQPKLAYTP